MSIASRNILVAAAALLSTLLATAASAEEDGLEVLEQQAFQAAVERVAPSVVRIETIGGLEKVEGVLFGTGPTTGLVVSPDGYVVSSAFNFLNQPASILVQLPDGSPKPARLVATDHNRMIALLKIEAEQPLPVPEIAPPGEMRVGQWAVAVGRAFEGNRPNLAVGIVSALGRIWGKAVQTDAAVSPNNYGGPLVDVRGRVIGLLVPLSPQETREAAGVEWYDSGIGFAVVAQDIQDLLPRLKEGKDLFPGVAGISFAARSLYTAEPLIASCRPSSPAYEAGLRVGDRIVEADGRATARAAQVKEAIARRYAGDTLHLVALRGQQRINCDVTLMAKLQPYQHPFLGVLPMRTPQAEASAAQGVRVRYVYANSPAAAAGIQPGDLIVSLSGEAVRDADALRGRISDRQPGESIELELRRGEATMKLSAKLAALPEDVPPDGIPPARQPGKPPAGERPKVGTLPLKVPDFPNEVWAYVPDNYDPAAAYGVVIWLHAPGGFEPKDLIARWKPLCDRYDLILVAPKSAEADKWQTGDAALVVRLLEEVRRTYRVDPARVVISGREGGGTLALLVAFRHADRFRAVVAVDAPPAGRPPENEPLQRLAFYVAKSAGSRFAGDVEAAVARLREMKFPVTVKDLGADPRDLSPEELSEVARWIDALDRL